MHLFLNCSYSYVSLLSVMALVVEPRTPKKGVGVETHHVMFCP